MKALNQQEKKRSIKEEREYRVLIGLIEFYIKTGKPVGSNTLKETGFDKLSSATIRNYFANLEEQGYLEQQHTSGGRIPTEAAFQIYAKHAITAPEIADFQQNTLKNLQQNETKEISSYLQHATEELSKLTNCAVFISAPRFDQDYIKKIKLIDIDFQRCLCVVITDFGVIQTEVLPIGEKLNAFKIKHLEEYFHWRLSGLDKPNAMNSNEEELAQFIYNELMVRYVIAYSTFDKEDVFRSGFSKLLAYPEFLDASTLANSLTVLETKRIIRHLLRECSSTNSIKYWIGKDFVPITSFNPKSTSLAIPYYINTQTIGAVGIMGPIRMNYKNMFGILQFFSETISTTLTKSIYKHKINFRKPTNENTFLRQQENKLLEDKRL